MDLQGLATIKEEVKEEEAVSPQEEGAVGYDKTIKWADLLATPANSDAEEEPDVLNETLRPVRANMAMTARELSHMAQRWTVVKDELLVARRLQEEADAAHLSSAASLKGFLDEFGAEGRHTAGPFPRQVALVEAFNEAGQARMQQEEKRRQEQLEAEREIIAFRKQAREAAQPFEAKALALQKKLDRLRLADPANVRSPKTYKCPMCGFSGVRRGNECPNVFKHPVRR